MNDKDKEAFEKWYDLPADQTLNDPILYRQFLDDTLPDHTKTFCEKAWQAACKYNRKEYSNIMGSMTQTSQYNFKLQAENKKLRGALHQLRGLFLRNYNMGLEYINEALKEVEDK